MNMALNSVSKKKTLSYYCLILLSYLSINLFTVVKFVFAKHKVYQKKLVRSLEIIYKICQRKTYEETYARFS